MRVLTLCIVFLFIIQHISAEDCQCSCCTGNNCVPTRVGLQSLFICSDYTCKPEKCDEWYYGECILGTSNIKAVCLGAGSEHLLSSLFIVFGLSSIILMMKD